MGLTSTGLLVVLWMVGVVAVVLAIIDRPRPRGQGAQLAARAARVVAVGVSVLLIAGVTLNNTYLFYTSWSDLFGATSPAATQTINAGADPMRSHVIGAGLTDVHPPATFPALPDPGQRLQRYTVKVSPGKSAEVLVDLPLHYRPSSGHRYPVILGLHAFPSVPMSLVKSHVVRDIEDATADHRLADTIVVIPQINLPESVDTECTDGGPGQQQVDTWLARDLPEWVVRHFPVRTDRGSWATIGYSFGGWCAASLTVRHPDVFGAALVFLGYFRPFFETAYRPTVSSLAGYDLVRLEQNHPAPVGIWVMTSRADGLSFPSTDQFIRAAKSPTLVESTIVPEGGHRLGVLLPFVPKALDWLGRTLPGFRP